MYHEHQPHDPNDKGDDSFPVGFFCFLGLIALLVYCCGGAQ